MIWRTLRRERLRSVLVLVLAGVPALLIGIGALALPSVRAADRDFTKREYGATTLSLDVNQSRSTASAVTAVRQLLPSGASVLVRQQTYIDIVVDGRKVNGRILQQPWTDPLLAGVLHVESGRLPGATGEVALTPSTARDLHLRLGSRTPSFTVVGIARDPNDWSDQGVFAAPGTYPRLGQVELLVTTADPTALLGLSDGSEGALFTGAELHDKSLVSDGRYDLSNNESTLTLALGAVLILALGSLLVSSALRVTASRAVLDLRLLHEAGATRGQVTGLLVRQGVALGAVGGLVGTLAGVPIGTVLLGPLQSLVGRQLSTSGVSLGLVALALALALACSALGALFAAPATVREVSRGKLPSAPAGRTTLGRSVAGLVTAAGSLALLRSATTHPLTGGTSRISADRRTQAVLLASILLIAALVLLSPAVAALWERGSRQLGPTARMAGREVTRRAGRHRLAAATVAVAIGGLSLAATALAGSHARSVADAKQALPADILLVSGAGATSASASLIAGLPVVATSTLLQPASLSTDCRTIASGREVCPTAAAESPSLLEALGVQGDLAPVRAALARGEVVVNTRAPADPVLSVERDSVRIKGFRAAWPHGDDLPDVITPASDAEATTDEFGSVVVRLDRPVTRADVATISARSATLSVQAALQLAPKASENAGPLTALAATALLTTVLVGLASTALAAVDARSDTALLHQVGARRRDHRRLRAWRAATISGQGALAGAVLGTVGGLVTSDGNRDPLSLSLVAVLCAIGAPLALALLAWVSPVRVRRTA